MLMAVLDGIQNKMRPGDPLDKDIYDLQPEELDNVPTTPRSLEASLDALQRRPRVPAPRRRLHPRRHRHLDLVQADPRSRRPSASAPTPTSSRSTTTSERNRARAFESPPLRNSCADEAAGSGQAGRMDSTDSGVSAEEA